MSENKNYKIIKTYAGTVSFLLHPISNPMRTLYVRLTDEHPVQPVPLDWALGVFADSGNYALYENKKITFDDNDDIVNEAFNAGVYFDDKLDFKPAAPDYSAKILDTLKAGSRQAIMKLIETEGDNVKTVASTHINELTQGVIQMLEKALGIQLIVDGE